MFVALFSLCVCVVCINTLVCISEVHIHGMYGCVFVYLLLCHNNKRGGGGISSCIFCIKSIADMFT